MSKKKKKFKLMQIVPVIIFMIMGGLCGVLGAKYIDDNKYGFMGFIVIIVILYAAILIQIIIHEGGHLIFGLLSGYKFSSFRIFNFMLIKEDGKFKIKNLSLAGTGGQCLMSPPELIDGEIPYKLYNLGGSMLNVIVSAIFLGIYAIWPDVQGFSIFLLILSIVGITFAFMNGVPMRLGIIDNDGYNALSLGKNSSALKAFWIQLKVNELASKGVRLKDMPDELFVIPNNEEMKNSMVAASGVFTCNRLIDEHKFEEAQKLINNFLKSDTAIIGLHRNLLICDEIYCKIILGNDKDEINSLLSKEQKKFMKAMKKFPSVVRTEYVYALLIEEDKNKADEIKNIFNKISKTYPYKSEIESEAELIEIAENKLVNNLL